MPYKDKTKQKEAMRKAVDKHRQGITSQGITKEGITEYPAILEALVDPIKRAKLKRIHESLRTRGLLGEVRYGVYGPTFDIVGELLEVTS